MVLEFFGGKVVSMLEGREKEHIHKVFLEFFSSALAISFSPILSQAASIQVFGLILS